MTEVASARAPVTGQELYQILHDIEQRAVARAAGLPGQHPPEVAWEGVLFSVGGRSLVTSLGDVKEILNYPRAITAVPGTKPWVKGIANIRGNLISVIDLQAFLFGRLTVPGRRSRVLVAEQEGFPSGLLVDAMVGIRHFRPSDRIEHPTGVAEVLRPFVEAAFLHGGEQWPVFNMGRLLANKEFQYAAA